MSESLPIFLKSSPLNIWARAAIRESMWVKIRPGRNELKGNFYSRVVTGVSITASFPGIRRHGFLSLQMHHHSQERLFRVADPRPQDLKKHDHPFKKKSSRR
jgi:hypothetical protein